MESEGVQRKKTGNEIKLGMHPKLTGAKVEDKIIIPDQI